MTYLLDTNVLSELRKPVSSCDACVRAWADRQLRESLFISVISVMEIEVGIRRVERRDVRQAYRLRQWLEGGVLPAFGGRILEVDVSVAQVAGGLHVPDPRPERDAFIAATALVHSHTVVTRNVVDFVPTGVRTLNPWLS